MNNEQTFYIPSDDPFTDINIEQLEQIIEAEERSPMKTETVYMTPEDFAASWLVVGWMREKYDLAKRENTMLEVEVQKTPFGRFVLELNVVGGN